MRTAFRKSFARDLKKIKDRALLDRVRKKIEEVEQAASLSEVQGVKKLGGAEEYYRVRVGSYRIGIAVEEEEVEFIRFLHRRDIYRYFP